MCVRTVPLQIGEETTLSNLLCFVSREPTSLPELCVLHNLGAWAAGFDPAGHGAGESQPSAWHPSRMIPGTSLGRAIACSGLEEPEVQVPLLPLLPPTASWHLKGTASGGQGAHGFRQRSIIHGESQGAMCGCQPSQRPGRLRGRGWQGWGRLISGSQGRPE